MKTTKQAHTHTVRIKQKASGGWRVISYHPSLDEALSMALIKAMGGWVIAVFEGRKKLTEVIG